MLGYHSSRKRSNHMLTYNNELMGTSKCCGGTRHAPHGSFNMWLYARWNQFRFYQNRKATECHAFFWILSWPRVRWDKMQNQRLKSEKIVRQGLQKVIWARQTFHVLVASNLCIPNRITPAHLHRPSRAVSSHRWTRRHTTTANNRPHTAHPHRLLLLESRHLLQKSTER